MAAFHKIVEGLKQALGYAHCEHQWVFEYRGGHGGMIYKCEKCQARQTFWEPVQ